MWVGSSGDDELVKSSDDVIRALTQENEILKARVEILENTSKIQLNVTFKQNPEKKRVLSAVSQPLAVVLSTHLVSLAKKVARRFLKS